MYLWRKLNENQREELLEFRRFNDRPWHSPQHQANQNGRYLLTAACYEHRHVIGQKLERMADFCDRLLKVLEADCDEIYAWCVLPNHYHALGSYEEITGIIPRHRPAAWSNRFQLEWCRQRTRAQSLIQLRRNGNEIGPAFLGDIELRSSQSGAPRLCSAVTGLAVFQRRKFYRTMWTRAGRENLAGISSWRVWQKLGSAGTLVGVQALACSGKAKRDKH